ncbi:hypothetical protein ACFP2T_37540 [Plantactinospora solaniradicis]|uniref:Helix-turn-helix domain-containing protein n=1 Tax=Plantactinospora solaniradicis TaxID=1723736 RepID=A0ABW1KLT5_9ACTN
MGRIKKPIIAEGPTATLALELRTLRRNAGDPAYRLMGKRGNFSHTGLSQADRGDKLPTWECMRAYVLACGTTDEELAHWRTRWESTKRAVELRKLTTSPPPLPVSDIAAAVDAQTPQGPRLPDLELAGLATMEELVDALDTIATRQQLDTATLIERMNMPRPKYQPVPASDGTLPPSQVRCLLRQPNRPTLREVERLVAACGGSAADLVEWCRHWRRLNDAEIQARYQLMLIMEGCDKEPNREPRQAVQPEEEAAADDGVAAAPESPESEDTGSYWSRHRGFLVISAGAVLTVALLLLVVRVVEASLRGLSL